MTHAEYRTACNARVPRFCLVDKEVLAFEKVYQLNASSGDAMTFPPAMNNPSGTFGFIAEIRSAKTNNAVFPFENVSDACDTLTTQIAHFFGELLIAQESPAAQQMQELLSEVVQLREEVRNSILSPGSLAGDRAEGNTQHEFVTATQLLVEGTYKQLRSLLVLLSGGMVEAVSDLLTYASLDDYLKGKGAAVKELTGGDLPDRKALWSTLGRPAHVAWFVIGSPMENQPGSSSEPVGASTGYYSVSRNKSVEMNQAGKDYLASQFDNIRQTAKADGISSSPNA